MKTALFTNFSNEAFTGSWDGRTKTIPAGESVYMPDYLAKHFAKHLTNRELLRSDKDGNLLIKDGDKATSPKVKVERGTGREYVDNDLFMSLFSKAYTEEDDQNAIGEQEDPIEVQIAVANKNRKLSEGKSQSNLIPETRTPEQVAHQDGRKEVGVQVVLPPDFEEDDEESEFGDKPKEGDNQNQ